MQISRVVRSTAVAFALGLSTPVAAATIYGTIRENNKPLADAEVRLVCDKAAVSTKTDRQGAYRLTLNWIGKCMLHVAGASTPVGLFVDPVGYNFQIRRVGGKAQLVPK